MGVEDYQPETSGLITLGKRYYMLQQETRRLIARFNAD